MADLLAAMDEAVKETEAELASGNNGESAPGPPVLTAKSLSQEAQAEPAPPPPPQEDDDELSDDLSDAEAPPLPQKANAGEEDDDFDWEDETGTVAVEALPQAPAPPPPQEPDEDPEEVEQRRLEEEKRAAEEAAAQAKEDAEKEARAAEELARVRAAAAVAVPTMDPTVAEGAPTTSAPTTEADTEGKEVKQWGQVEKMAASASTEQPANESKSLRKKQVAVSYREAIGWFAAADISQELTQIETTKTVNEGFFARLFSCLTATSLNTTMEEERNRAFAYGRMAWKEEDLFVRMLQTIYMRLTETKLHVPRVGGHWEDIGCQGNDPSTDVRVPGTGMLGVLQIIWMLSNYGDIARWIHRISNKEQEVLRTFPFFVTASWFTRTSLEAMREGKLNGLFNAAGPGKIMDVLGKLFIASYWNFAKHWGERCLDMHKFDATYKEISAAAKANPEGYIASFERAAEKFKDGAKGKALEQPDAEAPLSFFDMDEKKKMKTEF